MAPLSVGTAITINATVVHAVDLGGGETNYCLGLPSGRTTWVLGVQLNGSVVADGTPDDGDAKSVPGPTETKAVPGPPTKKAAPRAQRKPGAAPA